LTSGRERPPARWLHAWGNEVALWSLSDSSGGDAGINRLACDRLGLPEVEPAEVEELDEYAVIVDAVFGTGLTRTVEGRYARALELVNGSRTPVVAADLPSGLHADTGRVLGVAVEAVCTVTFGAAKPGLFCGSGPALAGDLVLADLGLGAVAAVDPIAGVPERSDLRALWPFRASDAHKTTSGHLAVLAGSTAMAGAAVLCCLGARAVGAGLVTLFVPRGALPRLGALPPEVMVCVSGEGDVLQAPALDGPLGRATALVAGPGLGGGHALPGSLASFLRAQWSQDERPFLADADALAAVEEPPRADAARVITPHPGEAARVLGRTVGEVQADRFAAVQALSAPGRTALLKGPHTLVATPGRRISVNPTGNPVLATGGTGDVLAGLVGALLARGLTGHDAATLGAWLHGHAADRLAAVRSEGHGATDVALALPDAIADLLGEDA